MQSGADILVKSDYPVLVKTLAFYGKTANNWCEFGQKWPKPYEGAAVTVKYE